MDKFFQDGEKYINQVIRPLLPNAQLGGFLCYGDEYRFSIFGPGHLSQSIYEKKINDGIYLLHFTSITNLLNIIQEKRIRMSDFNFFHDEMEFNFARNIVTKEHNHNIKSNLFAVSFCEYSDKIIKDDFIWNEYGRNHEGVGINFKIHRDKGSFIDFYLANIHYRNENQPIEELVLLKKRHDEFKLEYGWAISNIDEILFSVYSMYKRENPYKSEREVRLLKYIEKQENAQHNPSIYPLRYLFNENTQILNYFYEISLEDEIQKVPNPYISIESIFIGKKIFGTTLGKLEQIIRYEFKKSFSREPNMLSLFWN